MYRRKLTSGMNPPCKILRLKLPPAPTKTISSSKQPLKYGGSLDHFESTDVTPVIGTEYPTANLIDLINAPNADELLRDLAIKSERTFRSLRPID